MTGLGERSPEPGWHGRRGLLMIACCVPIVVVAVLAVATGVVGAGAILVAFGCVAMMAVMMVMMPGGHGHR